MASLAPLAAQRLSKKVLRYLIATQTVGLEMLAGSGDQEEKEKLHVFVMRATRPTAEHPTQASVQCGVARLCSGAQ